MRIPRRVAGAAVAIAALACGTWATCSACGRAPRGGATTAPGVSSAPVVNRTSLPAEASAAATRDVAMWTVAREGAVEDLAALAVHEGAVGLVEAAAEPELRETALRAMGYARGWAQLPFLARTAAGTEDGDAKLALEAAVDLGARPRSAEDVEDFAELREGCESLGALARDTARAKERRIVALRALRMLPCPTLELPTDLDAR